MLNKVSILYVEDEDFIRENTAEALSFMSDNVITAIDGNDAYQKYLKINPDIIISDIEMPNMNGLELVEKIRKNDKEVQIIITTAYINTHYLLKAVELNLVKYLTKPIFLLDLKNALNTCLYNLKNKEKPYKYFNENDYFDIKTQTLIVSKENIKLDYHEREFLKLLILNSNRIVNYEEIEATIWEDGMSSAALRSLVRNLRQKLPEGVIENISKTGYKVVLKK